MLKPKVQLSMTCGASRMRMKRPLKEISRPVRMGCGVSIVSNAASMAALCAACQLTSRSTSLCCIGFTRRTGSAARGEAMREIKVEAPGDWDVLICLVGAAHLLQTWEWGLSKKRNGWAPQALVWDSASGQVNATAMLLSRQIKILSGFSITVLYCPKGPTLNWADQELVSTVLQDLETYAKKQKAIFLKVDPDVVLGTGLP